METDGWLVRHLSGLSEEEQEQDDLALHRRSAGKRSLTARIEPRPPEWRDASQIGYLTHSVAPIQREAAGATAGVDHDPFAIHVAARDGVRGGGSTLPHLEVIQKAFGHHDVTEVRAHVGGTAASAAERIGARAYAFGDDVAFQSAPDLRQAAHEAAHVVQQRGGVRLDGGVGRAGDAYEQHADAVAELVVRGESAEALLDTMAHRGAAGGPAVQRDTEGAARLRELIAAATTEAAIGPLHDAITSGARHGRGSATRLTISVPAVGGTPASTYEIEPGEMTELRDLAIDRRGSIGREAVRAEVARCHDASAAGRLLTALGRSRRAGPRGGSQLNGVELADGTIAMVPAADLAGFEREVLTAAPLADPAAPDDYEATPGYADATGAAVSPEVLAAIDAARAEVTVTPGAAEDVEFVNPAVLSLFPVQSGGGIRRQLFRDLTVLLARQESLVHDLTADRGRRRFGASGDTSAAAAGGRLSDLAELRTEIAAERTACHQRVVAELERLFAAQHAAETGSADALGAATSSRRTALESTDRALIIRFLILTTELYARNRDHADDLAAARAELTELGVTEAERAAAASGVGAGETTRRRERLWRELRGQVAAFWSAVVGSSRVDLQACKLEYSIVSPK